MSTPGLIFCTLMFGFIVAFIIAWGKRDRCVDENPPQWYGDEDDCNHDEGPHSV